jgi:UDP:flavonoid glycosyltransferase YjiC (YdhE family)
VVVCNGGSLSTQQAFVAGVPVVGVAANLDQHLNMEAIERAGAGILLRTEWLKERRVTAAVQEAISRPEYRQAARELAEAYARDFAGFAQHVEGGLGLDAGTAPATSRSA